ncbi:MAG: hypothetical protein ABSG57_04285 [Candidatus Bathyarchaeia archaeon]
MKRFTDKDFARAIVVYREVAMAKKRVKRTPGELINKTLFEQVEDGKYLGVDLSELQFITGKEGPLTKWETDDLDYLPLPRLPWRRLHPLCITEESAEQLYTDVRRFIYDHIDFSKDVEYDLCASWVLHTWRLENWNVTPYLSFFGPPASGKTWAMEVLAALSFRSLLAAMSPASLYYATQEWHPTCFLDETEMYLRGEEKADILNYLNMGYRRGQVVIRTTEDKDGSRSPVMFDVFGPKCLAGTKELFDTLKSRSFTFTMSRKTREIKMTIDEDAILQLRNRLFSYRVRQLAANRNLILSADTFLNQIRDGRLRELFHPLISCCPQSVIPLLVEYAVQLDTEKEQEEALSLEARVFNAVLKARQLNEDFIPLKAVAEIVNENLPLKEGFSNRAIGTYVAKLGFKKQIHKNRAHVVWDEKLITRLAKRYPIDKADDSPPEPEPYDHYAHPPQT